MRRFELSVGEPWDFNGPDGQNRIEVGFVGLVEGPDKPNWQGQYALLEVLRPFTWGGESVERLLGAPRYRDDALEGIVRSGGTVGVSRVRAGVRLDSPGPFKVEDVEYIIIGSLRPLR
jgi:hypothetical protein